jgi:hypothetical protein
MSHLLKKAVTVITGALAIWWDGVSARLQLGDDLGVSAAGEWTRDRDTSAIQLQRAGASVPTSAPKIGSKLHAAHMSELTSTSASGLQLNFIARIIDLRIDQASTSALYSLGGGIGSPTDAVRLTVRSN